MELFVINTEAFCSVSVDMITTGDAYLDYTGAMTFIANMLSITAFLKPQAFGRARYGTYCIWRILGNFEKTGYHKRIYIQDGHPTCLELD